MSFYLIQHGWSVTADLSFQIPMRLTVVQARRNQMLAMGRAHCGGCQRGLGFQELTQGPGNSLIWNRRVHDTKSTLPACRNGTPVIGSRMTPASPATWPVAPAPRGRERSHAEPSVRAGLKKKPSWACYRHEFTSGSSQKHAQCNTDINQIEGFCFLEIKNRLRTLDFTSI